MAARVNEGEWMKITRVSTAVVEGNFPWVLVKIETDEGITGLGEAYWGVGVAELVHKAAPVIIGENPFNVGKLYEMMIRCLSGEGSLAGATVTAISGIEIALWDLVGRALNTPIYNLFGGRFRDKIRLYADCHAGATHTPRVVRRTSARGRRRRLHRDQIRPRQQAIPSPSTSRRTSIPAASGSSPSTAPSAPPSGNWMVSIVAAVREAVGPDIMVAMDCHWKFAVNDAHPARPGPRALRSPLAGRPGAAGKHRSPASGHRTAPGPRSAPARTSTASTASGS